MVDTIIPAANTPRDITIRASLYFIFNSEEAIQPVHAPVVGIGMATNMNRPNKLYFFIVDLVLFKVLLFSQPMVLEKRMVFSK